MKTQLCTLLRRELGRTVTGFHPVGGGSISEAAVVEFSNPPSLFIKWNLNAPARFFAAEADGLQTLRKSHVVRVPQVLFFQDTPCDGPPCIVLELLSRGEKTERTERNLGEALAALHLVRSEQFGYAVDNFIGLSPQSNSWLGSWGEFFFERRLWPQLTLGRERHWVDEEFVKLLEAKRERIIRLLDAEPEAPSLLHGDLWSGNVIWTAEGPALIDPAVYYGSREADLAFTELFGGFGNIFREAYEAALPLFDGYHERKMVLNLYHIMNHANMFGGSYIRSAWSVLQTL